MNYKLIFIFSLLSILLVTCKKGDEQILPDFPWDCDYDIGTYELLPTSYAAIPYEGKNGVVFQDSLGNDIHFTETEILSLHQASHIVKQEPNDESIDINYCYYKDSKSYQLYNDSLKISISSVLSANPYRQSPLKNYIADQLSVTISKTINQGFFYSSFSKTIDQRTFPTTSQNAVDSVYECFGRTFLNVEHQQSIFNPTNIYFNLTEGVVSFKDDTGKKWRFERFE